MCQLCTRDLSGMGAVRKLITPPNKSITKFLNFLNPLKLPWYNHLVSFYSQVVYVKNLPNKTTEEDLIALFGSFQSRGQPRIVFKLLSGRMKGQAFITFPGMPSHLCSQCFILSIPDFRRKQQLHLMQPASSAL